MYSVITMYSVYGEINMMMMTIIYMRTYQEKYKQRYNFYIYLAKTNIYAPCHIGPGDNKLIANMVADKHEDVSYDADEIS